MPCERANVKEMDDATASEAWTPSANRKLARASKLRRGSCKCPSLSKFNRSSSRDEAKEDAEYVSNRSGRAEMNTHRSQGGISPRAAFTGVGQAPQKPMATRRGFVEAPPRETSSKRAQTSVGSNCSQNELPMSSRQRKRSLARVDDSQNMLPPPDYDLSPPPVLGAMVSVRRKSLLAPPGRSTPMVLASNTEIEGVPQLMPVKLPPPQSFASRPGHDTPVMRRRGSSITPVPIRHSRLLPPGSVTGAIEKSVVVNV